MKHYSLIALGILLVNCGIAAGGKKAAHKNTKYDSPRAQRRNLREEAGKNRPSQSRKGLSSSTVPRPLKAQPNRDKVDKFRAKLNY